jgi:hypothetical protein
VNATDKPPHQTADHLQPWKETPMTPTLTLLDREIEAITGYRTPSRQLQTLHARGFARAYRDRAGRVVLEREHYNAVCRGDYASSGRADRPGVNVSFLKRAA